MPGIPCRTCCVSTLHTRWVSDISFNISDFFFSLFLLANHCRSLSLHFILKRALSLLCVCVWYYPISALHSHPIQFTLLCARCLSLLTFSNVNAFTSPIICHRRRRRRQHTQTIVLLSDTQAKKRFRWPSRNARVHTHTHSLQFIASCDCSNHSAIGIAIKFTYKFTGAEYFIEIDVLMVLFYILFSVDGDNECSWCDKHKNSTFFLLRMCNRDV